MKKIFSIAVCLIIPASGLFADQESGRIFIRTLRGEAMALITADTLSTLSVNDTARAKNVQIKVGEGEFASFALSNRCAGVFKGKGTMLFADFRHKSTVINDVNLEEEAIPSDIEIYLESGDLTISRAQPRPSSKLIISTPFGNFHCIGKEIKVCVSENSATAYAYRTPFNFHPANSKNPEYIGTGYSITALKEGANISLKRAPLKAESDMELADFNSAENAWRGTLFTQNGDDKTLSGKRMLQNSFHLKRPIIPRRR